MKKLFVLFAIAGALVACDNKAGNSGAGDSTGTDPVNASASTTTSTSGATDSTGANTPTDSTNTTGTTHKDSTNQH
jgi:hypothetical protein